MISARLMLVYLAIASFAPLVLGVRPGSWVLYYYGALLVWWGLVSVALVRRMGHRGETLERHVQRTMRQIRQLEGAEPPAPAAAARDTASLIVVARDDAELFDRLRKNSSGDDAVTVITDRRGPDRRRQLELYIPDRRRGERRRLDIGPLLHSRGWAEVTRPRR